MEIIDPCTCPRSVDAPDLAEFEIDLSEVVIDPDEFETLLAELAGRFLDVGKCWYSKQNSAAHEQSLKEKIRETMLKAVIQLNDL